MYRRSAIFSNRSIKRPPIVNQDCKSVHCRASTHGIMTPVGSRRFSVFYPERVPSHASTANRSPLATECGRRSVFPPNVLAHRQCVPRGARKLTQKNRIARYWPRNWPAMPSHTQSNPKPAQSQPKASPTQPNASPKQTQQEITVIRFLLPLLFPL